MMREDPDLRAAIAVLTMQRNRAEIRAILDPRGAAGGGSGAAVFPRSATFRWLMTRITGRSIASTVMGAALAKIPYGRLIAGTLFAWRH
jgi:hypothetical protein